MKVSHIIITFIIFFIIVQAGGSSALLMDLAAQEKSVHADFFNGMSLILWIFTYDDNYIFKQHRSRLYKDT